MIPEGDKPPQADTLADAKAIRFAMACFLAVQCLPLFRYSLAIPTFGGVFRDMLGYDADLPMLTRVLMGTYPLALVIGMALPIGGAVVLWKGKSNKSFYTVGILVLIATVLSEVVMSGLFTPLIKIIQAMNGPM